MERNGAEIARPEAAAVMGKGEFNLLDGWHTTHFLINGVIIAFVGQLRHGIQFFGGKGQCRRILHQILFSVLLHHGMTAYMILLLQLKAAGTGIGLFILRNLIVRGAGDGIFRQRIGKRAQITGAPNIPHCRGVLSSCHTVGNLGDRVLPHAVDEKICAAFR